MRTKEGYYNNVSMSEQQSMMMGMKESFNERPLAQQSQVPGINEMPLDTLITESEASFRKEQPVKQI